jgi:hypothetical protein
MQPLIVTAHAVQRYVERIGGDEDIAVAVLSGGAVQLAVRFGARCVRIPGGRVLMKFTNGVPVVLTVIPIDEYPPQILRPQSLGGPPPSRDELPHLRKDPC